MKANLIDLSDLAELNVKAKAFTIFFLGKCAFFLEVERLAPNNGSFEAILTGRPGFRVVNVFDKGFL